MGESKRRGSKEERITNATKLTDDTVNYGLILDRSRRSKHAFAKFLNTVTGDLADAWIKKVQTLDEMKSKYVLLFGTYGYSGGLAIGARTDDELLETSIPALMQRVAEKKQTCGFLINIQNDLAEKVHARIKELTPIVDRGGNVIMPSKLEEFVTKINNEPTVAFHGGDPVSPHMIVLDGEYSEQNAELMARAINAWEATETPEMSNAFKPLPMERMKNGTLVLTAYFPDDTMETIEVPVDRWQYRTENQQRMKLQAHDMDADKPLPLPGRFIAMDSINITDEDEKIKLMRLVAQLLAKAGIEKPDIRDMENLPILAEALTDKTLRLTATISDTEIIRLIVPKNAWHELTEDGDAIIPLDADTFFDNTDNNERVLVFTRDHVVLNDTVEIDKILARLTASPDNARRFTGKVVFEVSGYGYDPRMLWQIDEVSEYFRRLWDRWPIFIYFLNRDPTLWRLLLSILCTNTVSEAQANTFIQPDQKVMTILNQKEVATIMLQAMTSTKEMIEAWGQDATQRDMDDLEEICEIVAKDILNPEHLLPDTTN